MRTPLVVMLLLAAPVAAQPPEATPEDREVAESETAEVVAPPRPSADDILAEFEGLVQSGGLTADEAAQRAVGTAPSMERAALAVKVAEAGARQAWQGFFPQLEVSARYTRLSRITQPEFGSIGFTPDQLALARGAADAVSDPNARFLWNSLLDAFSDTEAFSFPVLLNQYGLRASLTLPVSDIFFTVLPSYRAANMAVDAQEAQRAVEERAISLRTREAYYELARARGGMIVAARTVAQTEARRDQVRALVEGGAAARVDLLRLEAQLAQAQVAHARAQGGATIAERALRLLMHVEGDPPIVLGEDVFTEPEPIRGSLGDLADQGLASRPELIALRQLEASRERSVDAERGRRYPQLAVQANFDYANPNNRIIPQQQEFNGTWDLSVLLRWSPNEMGVARQRVEQARASLLQVRTDMDQLRDGVRLEVERAYEELRTAKLAFAAARTGLEAARESYRVRVEQLAAGAAVTSDVIDAETDLARARLQAIDAAIGIRLADARLRQAIGQ